MNRTNNEIGTIARRDVEGVPGAVGGASAAGPAERRVAARADAQGAKKEERGVVGVKKGALVGAEGKGPEGIIGTAQNHGNRVVAGLMFLVIVPLCLLAAVYWSGWLFYTRVIRRRAGEMGKPWG